VAQSGNDNVYNACLIDASIHYANSNFSLAIKNLEKCERLKPNEASIYYLLSKNYYGNQNVNACLYNANKACQLAPKNVFYVLWYAEKLKQSGQTKQAVQALEKHLEWHIKDDQYVQILDQLYVKNGYQNDLRIALLEQQKKACGYKLNSQLKLIDLYVANLDFIKAHALYDEIKKASPNKLQYFIDDANLYLKNNDENSANAIYQAALKSHPNDFKLNFNLFKYAHKIQNYKEAANYLKQGFNDPKITVEEQIKICQDLNQMAQKDSLYNQYLPILIEQLKTIKNPVYKVLQQEAELCEQLGHKQAAYTIYLALTDLMPSNYTYWFKTITIAKSLDHYDWVLQTGTKAIEAFPTIAELYISMAEANNHLKQYQQAKKFAETGQSFSADNQIEASILIQLGIAETHTKQFEKAILHFESAIAKQAKNATAYEAMGDAYMINNNKTKALECWKTALALGNNHSKLLRKIKDESYIE
jgi:tetratricopeptide (TPR) repeat protein